MKEIPLTRGKVAFVDDGDYERLSSFKWYAHPRRSVIYARTEWRVNGKKHRQSMHRYIMENPAGMQIDHIDGNGLNNQKSNLRICNNSQNAMNRTPYALKLKGVSFRRTRCKWEASIKISGVSKFIGYFPSAIEAAKAYNKYAIKLFGEFARPNTTSAL